MANITTREVGATAVNRTLTNAELDANFINLNTDIGTRIPSTEKGAAGGVASLDGSGKVPAAQLPSYVDDVLEAANLAAFPVTGETGKIYVALDTNKTYRWSGSAYVYITSGAIDSVAGKTGIVTLVKGDVGLANVDNTSDADKPVSTAQQTALNAKQASLGYTPVNKAGDTVTGDLLNSAAYSAPNSDSGSGTKVTVLGSTGTGAAGTSGGNGYIEIIGAGATAQYAWTSFSGSSAARRGGVHIKSGTAQADAGNTYRHGSHIDIIASNGSNSESLVGLGGKVQLRSGGGGGYAGVVNNGASLNLLGATGTGSGRAVLASGAYTGPSFTSNPGSSIDISEATESSSSSIRLYIGQVGGGSVPGAVNGKAFVNRGVDYEILDAGNYSSYAQTLLVSGTSIKTVNNQSVLGSGNIQIDGGVTSFNTRTGALTLSSGDVTDALGYTPLSIGGGTLTGNLGSTANAALTLKAIGTGTYNISTVYLDSTLLSWEAPLTTDDSGGAKVPFVLTWRGGYASQGGLRLTGGSSGELGGNAVLHAGNYTNYSASLANTVQTEGGVSRSWNGQNLNELVSTGFWRGSAMTGAPDAGWWYITVEAHDTPAGTGWVKQRVTAYGAGNSYSAGTTFTRVRPGGASWNGWIQEIDSGNYTSFRGTQLISPNGATVVAADSAMPDAGHSFIHTLGLGPSDNDGHILGMTWASTTSVYGAQIWVDTDPNNRMAFRSRSSGGVWTGWNEVIHSSNYSSYALPLSGGTVSGYTTFSADVNMTSANSYLPGHFYTNTHDGSNVYFHVGGSGSTTNKILNLRVMNSSGGNSLYQFDVNRLDAPNLQINGNQVLHAGNYSTYSPSYGYFDDYQRGNYRVISDYSGGNTWYIRSNGRFTWARAHDWSQTFDLDLSDGGTNANDGWARFGQQTSNSTAGTWRGTRFVQYTGGTSIDGFVRAGQYFLGDNTNYLVNAGDGSLRVQTANGYIDIGPKNSLWCHIYSDRDFYTNRGIWINGSRVLDAGNYTSYSPSLTGSGASGTWGINVTGNANSASTLNSGATINGTAYFRKNQTAGDYTTASLWTESYGNTSTGIAFHISGVAGRYLEMRNNSADLFWQSSAILNAGNYGSYSTFSGKVISAGNNGFANDVYYVGVRNPIWSFGNSTAYGISYFQGTAGIGGADTFGVSVNGSTSATGVNFAVTPSASYVNNNVVLHAGNYSSYAAPATHYHDRIYNGASGSSGYLLLSSGNELEFFDSTGALSTLYLQYNGAADSLRGPGGNVILHAGNINSYIPNWSTGVTGSHIVQRDGNGYIYANHVNFNTGVENPTIANFITDNGDGWSRKSSLAHVKNQIRGVADGTWDISITGSASSAGSAGWATYGQILDTRAGQYSPNDYQDYRATFEFTNQIVGGGDWHTALTMQGWNSGYAAWQIIGPASSGAHENWYLRSGVNTSWNSLRTILHSGNYTNYAASTSHSHNYIPINPDGDGASWTYSDENPIINGVSIGGGQRFGADGSSFEGFLQAKIVNAYNGFVNSANGYYVGNNDFGANSNTYSTTRVIDGSGNFFGGKFIALYGNPADTINGGPWYGLGSAGNLFGPGDTVQLAGYYGLRLRASSAYLDLYQGSAWYSATFNAATLQNNGNQVLHAGNYTSYSPSLTGGGASGTWGINVTGSATTATRTSGVSGYAHAGTGMYAFYNWGGSDGGTSEPSASSYTTGISVGSNPGDQAYGFQIANNMWNTGLWTRNYNSGFGSWIRLLDSSNYSSYALPLSGGTLSGNLSFTNLYPNGNNAYGIQGNNGYFDTVNSGIDSDPLELVYVRGSSVKIGSGTYGSKPLYAVGIYDNGSRVLSQEGSSYYQVNTWLQLNGTHGLYWPSYYGAHLHANDLSTYTPIAIRGVKTGYTGICMQSMPQGGGNGHWMSNGNATGYYNESYGWKFLHENGNFYIFSGTYGGGTQYTALHSSNYNSYSPTLTGGGASGSWGISVTGSANSVNLSGHTITNSTWAGGAGYHGYQFNGGNWRFGFSSTAGVVDVYADGNFYATDSSHLVLHASNYSSYALPLSGGTMSGTIYTSAASAVVCQHGGSTRGYLYGDSAGFGFLTSSGSWAARVDLGTTNWTVIGNVTAYSDERLKKDWASLPVGFIERLAKVKSGTYTRIDTGERQAGASAQDMQVLLTEVVTVGTDDVKTLALAYGNAALVSAIELAKDNVELRARIERLESLIEQLLNKE